MFRRSISNILIFLICCYSIDLHAQGIMDSIKMTHPRLILTSQQIDNVKQWEKDDTLVQALLEVIHSYADSSLQSPVIAYNYDGPGDPRLKMERRNAMFRVLNCGLLYQITDAHISLNEQEALLKKNGKVVKVKIISPADAIFTIMSASPDNDREASNDEFSILTVEYSVTDIVKTEIQIELIPNDTAFTVHNRINNFGQYTKSTSVIYPNPCLKEVTIDLSSFSSKDVKYSLYDYFGRVLVSGVWHIENTSIIKWEPTDRGSGLKPGIYFLKIEDDQHTYTETLIKHSH